MKHSNTSATATPVQSASPAVDAAATTPPDAAALAAILDTVTAPATAPDTTAPAHPAGDPAALLKLFGKAAATAATATLTMGKLGGEYITARMLNSTACLREAAVKCLVSTWQEHADSVVTANRVTDLVRLYAAWAAFNTATGYKAGKVPVGVIREFGPFLDRDTTHRDEVWGIMPGVESAARILWQEVTTKGLTQVEAHTAVVALLAAHTATAAEEAADKAAAAKATAATTAATAGATADDKAKAAAAAAAAKAAADKAAADAAAAKAKADKAAAKAGDGPATVAKPNGTGTAAGSQPKNVLATLADTAKSATPKDYAALLATAALKADDALALVYELSVALFTASQQPDDLLRAMLDGAKASGSLSKPATRAADSALVLLAAKPVATAATVAAAAKVA